jgi:hypothetical protein
MDTTKSQARIVNLLLIVVIISAMLAGKAKAANSTFQRATDSAVTAQSLRTANPKPVAPSITVEPVSQTVNVGQSATFSVTNTGTVPFSYQWRKNGAAIRGATSSSYTSPATSASNNGSLFTVKVSNSRGSVTSNAAALLVDALAPVVPVAPVAPAIASQPIGQTVNVGQSAAFSVSATGAAPLSYQWNKNSAAINGATSSSYSTPATAITDNAAQFTVMVSDSVGTVTSSAAVLTVNAIAPAITAQPTGETVNVGQSATFSVADTGTAPINYQWKRNGTAIAGATSSSYTTPAVATTDNASQFTVGVSNSAGTATSNAAVLTVNSPTLILNASATSLSFGSVTVSTASVQTVTLTNAGTGNVTISSISVSGSGFNASGVSSGTIIAPGQSAILNATFDPANSGGTAGSITVASNATSGAKMISLAGTGMAPVTHSAMLSWSPSTSSVVSYNVYVSMVSGSAYTMVANASTPSYTDGNLQASQTRYYVVTAVDSNHNESAYSNQVVAIIP